jgi:dolichol-phosphate mannosyltransferase
VIVPTYNERASLVGLYPQLCSVLARYPSELIVVDDGSPDGTAEYARSLAGTVGCTVLERGRKLGLASAVHDGFARARGEVLVVMDADGSHRPSSIPDLVEAVTAGGAEFALGSRWVPGGSAAGLTRGRRVVSSIASALARPLVGVKDPMSGFFAFRRSILARADLSPLGYKIGLEILVRCRPNPVVEVPIAFQPRTAGESKLGRGEIGQYLRHVVRLYAFRTFGPARASSTR